MLKQYLIGLLMVFASAVMTAQVRPDHFPEETNPTNENFETYSQKNGINKRASLNNLRKFFVSQVNPVPVAFIPVLSGNLTNLGQFVEDPAGDQWYIDGQGNAIKLDGGNSATKIDSLKYENDTLFLYTPDLIFMVEISADSLNWWERLNHELDWNERIFVSDEELYPHFRAYSENENAVPGINFISSNTGIIPYADGFLVALDSDAKAILRNFEETDMVFYTDDVERMTIEANGNVGIGTNTPGARLDVVGVAKINTGTRNSFITGGNTTLTGTNNNAHGFQAGASLSTGDDNTLMGNQTGIAVTTGDRNSAYGSAALANVETGNNNVAIGSGAGFANQQSNNTFIGTDAGHDNQGSGNVMIGSSAGATELGSNQLFIDNSDTINPLVKGDFLLDAVEINGSLKVDHEFFDTSGDPGDPGQVLKSTGMGTTWADETGEGGGLNDFAFFDYFSEDPVDSPADSARRSGYTLFEGKVGSLTHNLNNYFWHTQRSLKNISSSGYMGTQAIDLDSLAFPAISSQYGKFGQWIEVFSWDNSINDPFDDGGNLLYNRGWNFDSGAPYYNSQRPKYNFSTELGYYPGNGNTLWIEEHPEVFDTTGRGIRPYDWYVAYDGSSAGFSITSDRTYVYKSPDNGSAGSAWEVHDFINGQHDINQDYHLRINNDYDGSIITKYWTPGNTWRNILAQDVNNVLHVGDSSGIKINNTLLFSQATESQRIKSSTDQLLLDSILVTLRNPGDGNFRNLLFEQPGDADRFVMGYGGQALTFGKLNASEAIFRIDQSADNYSMHIASDGKIRINMNAGFGGIDFTQFSNDAAGGYMQRNTAGSAWVAQYLNGSGDWTYNFTNTERFKLKADGTFNASAYDDTPPTGEPVGLIVHEADGDFKSVEAGEGLLFEDGQLKIAENDIVMQDGDTTCFVVMEDVVCVHQDSVFYTDTSVCYILLGDTSCIAFSTVGGNVYTTSGTIEEDRIVEIENKDFTITEFGAQRFRINAPFGTNKLGITSGSPLVPALTLQNYTSGNHLYLHFDGLFGSFRDYTMGVIPGESAFAFSDSLNLHNPFMKHYAQHNRLDMVHQTKFLGKLLDKDGDAGTSGQILASTGTQVNWINQSSGNGIYDVINDNDTAEVTSVLINPTNGLYLQHMSSPSDYWGFNVNVGQIIHNSTKSGDILELHNSHASAGTWISLNGASEQYKLGINKSNADFELKSGSTEVFTIENDPTVDNTLQLQADGDIRIADYPNTRDDGTPVNFLGTDANGVVQSFPIGDVSGSSDGNGLFDPGNELDTVRVIQANLKPNTAFSFKNGSTGAFTFGPTSTVNTFQVSQSGTNEPRLQITNTNETWNYTSGTDGHLRLQADNMHPLRIEKNPTVDDALYIQADGDVQLADYPNTRDDGTPTNFIGTDASGVIQSYPISQAGERIVASGIPAESKTNSTTADQDYTTLYTIPAGKLVAGKIYEVILSFKVVAGNSTALWTPYIKLGSTKVITPNAAVNYANGVTHYVSTGFYIHGTAAASASSQVNVYNTFSAFMLGAVNATGPLNHDTTGGLPIGAGITFNATGSTEILQLEAFQVKEYNP